ncbi:MAG: plasmid pRiA4b ORF-3 family protein [Gammaproteobacteria bacterium]|nr:plasmid pRiA4b ORF-3 family protein [Gammaproteobacteria bacterium]
MTNIYQLKITLRHTRPPIWRRVQVKGDTKLGKLHRIVQEAMGWTDSHLHAFRIGRTVYGVPDPDFIDDIENERSIRLDKIATEGNTFIYEYDFGDGWEHDIKVEKILNAEPGVHYPVCLAGKRACPPEDCGGVPGYEYLLEILSDPQHEEYEERREWLGGEFDPEAFDIDGVNRGLRER